MKKSTIYTIYEWLWHEVDSGVDYRPTAGGQVVNAGVDLCVCVTIFQHSPSL